MPVALRVTVREDADIEQVVQDMDYTLTDEAIVDTEIVGYTE